MQLREELKAKDAIINNFKGIEGELKGKMKLQKVLKKLLPF